jgi:hypothetical protein
MEITPHEIRLRGASHFNEGLRVGQIAAERALLEIAQTKQDYLNENERLTNLLLEAEDRIQELESALLMPFGTF